MRYFSKIAMAMLLAATMTVGTTDAIAQTRRSTTTSKTTTSTGNSTTTTSTKTTTATSRKATTVTTKTTSKTTTPVTSSSSSTQNTRTARRATTTSGTTARTGSTTGTTTSSSSSSRKATTTTSRTTTASSNSGTSSQNTTTRRTNTTTTSGTTAKTTGTTSATTGTTNGSSRTTAATTGNSERTINSKDISSAAVNAARNSSSSSKSGSTAVTPTTSKTTTTQTQTSTSNRVPQSTKVTNTTNDNIQYRGLGTVDQKTTDKGKNDCNVMTNHNDLRLSNNDMRDVERTAPRDRDMIDHSAPGVFSKENADHPHMFGYRTMDLPKGRKHFSCWGRDYYHYDGIYYRHHDGYYTVCRPPYSLVLDMKLKDMIYHAVHFAYYHNVYRQFDIIDSNYDVILAQNRTIAQNNAILAAQNSSLALNSTRAYSAYEIARALGLVQRYAAANEEYYYEDGVFFAYNTSGKLYVIVPPAGALVDELPDDYDTITLGGNEYYKVDDTVYRLTLVDGTPLLEVLGQMPSSMYSQYVY